jgi:hypothetical protein
VRSDSRECFVEADFWGTHGAMGGVPWRIPSGKKGTDMIAEGFPELQPTKISYDQDARAAREIWAWASPRIGAVGLFGGQSSSRTNV